jgi:hypothetical protein
VFDKNQSTGGRLRCKSNENTNIVRSRSLLQENMDGMKRTQDSVLWSGRLRSGAQLALSVTRSNKQFKGNEPKCPKPIV